MEIPKPIITFVASGTQIPLQIKELIEKDLPQEGIEWKRPYRQQSKTVYLESKFEPYTENIFNKYGLLEKQLLHTYWIECYDVDSYKQIHKENLINWINKFSKLNFCEWLVILIDNNNKKSNKSKLLPRSSVSDKIKADLTTNFKGVLDSHFSILTDPLKKETKSSDSFLQLLQKIRLLLLNSYFNQLKSYEDFIRAQREQRNNFNWDFFKFFLSQEELAFVFELLGLYDEALVQYDELDALFSQFISNINLHNLPTWLKNLIDFSCVWQGLCLSNAISFKLKEKLNNFKAGFLDLRNYLFSRQCKLLLLQHKPWEVTTRTLPFLRNCVNELKILEINLVPGALECWVFLSATEILSICERYNDSSQMNLYSKNTIDLRAFSRKKLKDLGNICGFFPNMKIESNHLLHVVNLIAGMGEDPYKNSNSKSAQDCLKDAINDGEIFLKNYLEFSELTMGTFKHIGRMREARLIGKELAILYMKMNNFYLALSFLTDLEKMFIIENWPMLLLDVRINILNCYKALNDKRKELIYCLYLSSSSNLVLNKRKFYFDQFISLSNNEEIIEKTIKIKMDIVFNLISINFHNKDQKIISNSENVLIIKLFSNLIDNLNCEKIIFYLKRSDQKGNCTKLKNNENLVTKIKKKKEKPLFQPLFDKKTGLICLNLERMLKRNDSLKSYSIDNNLILNEYEDKFICKEVCIKPGNNEFELNFKTFKEGIYILSQFCIYTSFKTYLISNEFEQFYFKVIFQEPNLKILNKNKTLSNDLLTGIIHEIQLVFYSGSNYFSLNSLLEIKCLPNLKIKFLNENNEFQNHLIYKLKNELKPFEKIFIDLNLIYNIENDKKFNSVQNIFFIYQLDSTKTLKVNLHFNVPFIFTFNLHTCELKKFIQISLSLNANLRFKLWDPVLKFININQTDDLIKCIFLGEINTINTIQSDEVVNFMWEIISESNMDLFNFEFTVNYTLLNQNNVENFISIFRHSFNLKKFNTIYTVRVSINPQTGSEFCRVGSLCHLCVKIEKITNSNDKQSCIMYKLIIDKSLWGINGDIFGILDEIQIEKCELNFKILPLISGFLPVPTIMLLKYVKKDALVNENIECLNIEQNPNIELVAFDVGQVYNYSRCLQVNVLPASGLIAPE